jgi:signal transduction histidine kinase
MKKDKDIESWGDRYRSALGGYLKPGAKIGLRLALELGREAADWGLETLDVAQVHKQAVQEMELPDGLARTRKRHHLRAKKFFEETLVPIEQTHRAAKADGLRVAELGEKLRERTTESHASNRRLKRGVVRRKAAEAALGKSAGHRVRLEKKSQCLESHLHDRMRRILAGQEDERKEISRDLQNEIAQILVAIQVRLLTLNQAIQSSTQNLKNEIAGTRSLVKQSARTIKRLAYESNVHDEG